MGEETKSYIHLHFIVFLWGFTAILGLLISVPAVEIVFYRVLLAFIALGIILLIKKRKILLGHRVILPIFFTGFIIAAHWILFFGAARVSTASICLAGMATTSFWTSLLEPALTNKKIKWYELSLGMVIIGGLYIIFRFEFNHALGLTMALGSAFLAALFTVINANFTHKYHHQTITFYEMLGATVGIALFFPFYANTFAPGGELQLNPTLTDWIYLGILAFICTVYAYSTSVRLMQKISAFGINLTVNLEPVYGIVLAFLFFGDKEKMNFGFYIGTLVILAAVLSYPLLNRFFHRKPLEVDNLR